MIVPPHTFIELALLRVAEAEQREQLARQRHPQPPRRWRTLLRGLYGRLFGVARPRTS